LTDGGLENLAQQIIKMHFNIIDELNDLIKLNQ